MPTHKGPKGVAQEMRKFKEGKLHSGSKTGPIVTDRKQAIAISLSEAGMKKPVKKSGMSKMSGKMSEKMPSKAKGYMGGGMAKAYAGGGMVKGTAKGMGASTKGGKYKVC